MKFLIINGPNLNLLGQREPGIYGDRSYDALCKMIADHAEKRGVQADFYQSNHEGGIIDAILNGDVLKAPTKKIPLFDFEVPTELPGVDPAILDPRDTYATAAEWDEKAKDLAGRFIKNFVKYESNEAGKALVAAGPQL